MLSGCDVQSGRGRTALAAFSDTLFTLSTLQEAKKKNKKKQRCRHPAAMCKVVSRYCFNPAVLKGEQNVPTDKNSCKDNSKNCCDFVIFAIFLSFLQSSLERFLLTLRHLNYEGSGFLLEPTEISRFSENALNQSFVGWIRFHRWILNDPQMMWVAEFELKSSKNAVPIPSQKLCWKMYWFCLWFKNIVCWGHFCGYKNKL